MKITSDDTAGPIRILQFKIYLQSVHGIVLAISIDNNLHWFFANIIKKT